MEITIEEHISECCMNSDSRIGIDLTHSPQKYKLIKIWYWGLKWFFFLFFIWHCELQAVVSQLVKKLILGNMELWPKKLALSVFYCQHEEFRWHLWINIEIKHLITNMNLGDFLTPKMVFIWRLLKPITVILAVLLPKSRHGQSETISSNF